MSAHAITPTATRPLQPAAPARAEPALKPVLERALQHTDELHELTVGMADEAARVEIEACCRQVCSDGRDWWDPRDPREADAEAVERALRYLALRGDRASYYRVVRSQAFPSLFRFEDLE